jgi:hypothetical protein
MFKKVSARDDSNARAQGNMSVYPAQLAALTARLKAWAAGSGANSHRPWSHSDAAYFAALSERGVRLAQKMEAGPRIPVGIQLEKAEVCPTSEPTWCLSRLSDYPYKMWYGRV